MILGIDTATSTGVLGIYDPENGLRGETGFKMKKGHGRILNPLLDQLFSHIGLSPGEISGVAVGVGPGSFTGTRVGITLARSLVLAREIPVWGFPTLTGWALEVHPEAGLPVLSILDARNERAYWALHIWEGGDLQTVEGEKNWSLDEIAVWCEDRYREVLLAGEFPPFYARRLADKYSGRIILQSPVQNHLRGGTVAYWGYLQSRKNAGGEEVENIKPRYLKGPAGLR